MAHFGLAALLLSFGLATAFGACPAPTCPGNYVPIVDQSTVCGYVCQTPAKLNCPAIIGGPRLCGGTSGTPCPSIACAQATSYAVSGPNGCAAAQASISAFAFSNSTYNSASLYTPLFKDFCTSPTTAKLEAYASAAADAYATAISQTLAHYNIYVCSCCLGNSQAYGVVSADLQAAALAQATSVQAALATVSDCYGNLLSAAYGFAQGFAQDVQLAIDTVYRKAISSAGNGCSATGLQTQIQQAVARATVCTFVDVFAAALDSQNPGLAYACGNTISLSGSSWQQKCDPYNNCPCTPAAYAYDNLGFDAGSFTPANPTDQPVWSVSSTGSTAVPAVIQSDILNVKGTTVRLAPKDGSYLAVVPAGCQDNSITTSVIVPPCASAITGSYVFKCNDYGSSFNDASLLTITATDYYSGVVVASKSIIYDCSSTGTATGSCSDSSLTSGGATNNGQWSALSLPVASGLYSVTITALGRNDRDCICASKLYVDAFSFA
ncbi:hypothetical protein WJX74_000371 [Apatococcus lobatus]|uniref:Uncharacterized protein n=1 Tax=Apatococcus lobatus TaxID=904363 RepID=A0AAW1RRF6_9CHLO